MGHDPLPGFPALKRINKKLGWVGLVHCSITLRFGWNNAVGYQNRKLAFGGFKARDVRIPMTIPPEAIRRTIAGWSGLGGVGCYSRLLHGYTDTRLRILKCPWIRSIKSQLNFPCCPFLKKVLGSRQIAKLKTCFLLSRRHPYSFDNILPK